MQIIVAWGFGTWGLLAVVAIAANLIFQSRLNRSLKSAPVLLPLKDLPPQLPRVTVVIPAYNEAVNLRPCLEAVLASHLPDPSHLQVIVADDESTDETAAIAQHFAACDTRITAFTVPPRPTDVAWQGKNWACTNGVERATGDYWLFIDADVRLEPDAIAIAVMEAERTQADLLSCAPTILCGCLAEWLVQPLVIALIAVGFDFTPVNDPAQPDKAFAAGPFMLFRPSAYNQIGGHRAVAATALEDVTLARRIKAAGLKLRYVLAGAPIKVRMYENFAGLWEGWTKNFHLGANRQVGTTLFAALAVKLIFVLPWSLALGAGLVAIANPAPTTAAIALVGISILALHLRLRLSLAQQLGVPPRYLWLGWLGGLLMTAIPLVSIIKVETGWGWTWRGRPLANAPQESP